MDVDEPGSSFAPEMNSLDGDLATLVGTSDPLPSTDYRRLDVLLAQIDHSDDSDEDKIFK